MSVRDDLLRIEAQVASIRRMVHAGAPVPSILAELASARAAVRRVTWSVVQDSVRVRLAEVGVQDAERIAREFGALASASESAAHQGGLRRAGDATAPEG